jgi:hypothetical protein
MTNRQTRLQTVTKPLPSPSVLQKGSRGTPMINGDEPEDLVCGSCGDAITRGVSAQSMAKSLIAPVQLLVQCNCGAHNLIEPEIVIRLAEDADVGV